MRPRLDTLRVLSVCLASATVLGTTADAAAPQARSIEGRIRKFECGDNCYLTIVDRSKKVHTGLCRARACAPWNEATTMPARFVNRRVVVTVGSGVQVDGSGNVMGRTTAFRNITFLD
jgi:hypothetical protein